MADTRLEELQECYDLLLKTARRVAKDLRHAVDQIPPTNPFVEMMRDRCKHFRVILDDVADYRNKLHLQISQLERENEMLTKDNDKLRLLAEKGC